MSTEKSKSIKKSKKKEEIDEEITIIILGEAFVGKTSLITRISKVTNSRPLKMKQVKIVFTCLLKNGLKKQMQSV